MEMPAATRKRGLLARILDKMCLHGKRKKWPIIGLEGI
jgi:hypothetical protein